jgi:hypothetical protein
VERGPRWEYAVEGGRCIAVGDPRDTTALPV